MRPSVFTAPSHPILTFVSNTFHGIVELVNIISDCRKISVFTAKGENILGLNFHEIKYLKKKKKYDKIHLMSARGWGWGEE